MSELIEQVRSELLHAIDTDQLVLPTLPEVALKVREASQDPDVDVVTLTKVIQNDTAVSARIVKVANSPLLRASRPIEDLRMAVSRLGINYTCNLATSLAMQQMFQATSDLVDERMRAVWSHSTEVAGIAHVLARHYTRLKPDQATLAGIVHQIGVLPILTYAEDNRRLLKDPAILDAIIAELHPLLGRKILEAWDFQAELIVVPEEHLNFEREVSNVDYADVIMVANLQSYIGSDHPLTQMDWSNISAFERLGLSPEINTMEVEDLSADMEAAMALLQ
ncbi:MAG TPA: HDOD domain-containing protein [Spongiibacteraceae bacterium]|nr:HDOD domain-containing protein [Spongiibacteraceae bacterium]